MASHQELVRSSRFIFSGTVVGRGASTVPAVQAKQGLITVRLERSLCVNATLGDLGGKIITVAAKAAENLQAGQRAVFFANSWVHGRGIAVREVGHVGIDQEENVASEVAKLPERHLAERVRQAALVVEAEVVAIDPPAATFDQHAALWAAAHLQIETTLHGPHRHTVILYFPTAPWPPWERKPRYALHQRGIFLLHAPSRTEIISSEPLPANGFVALDPADFQEASQKGLVEHAIGQTR